MSDEADNANDQAQQTLESYINEVRNRAKTGLAIMGFCWFCQETIRNQLFCSVECREDYDKRINLNRINGNG